MHSETVTILQKLAVDKTPEGRTKLADQIVNFYITDGKEPGFLSAMEKELLFDIVMRLVNNAKEEVKKSLAENLSEEQNVPKELILSLANDDISVAAPILQKNNLLNDNDLIGIIKTKGPMHQFSIAGREEISEEVADTLIEAGDPHTMKKLLENDGASISDEGMEKVTDYCGSMLDIHEPLLGRKEMTGDFAAKVYWHASESLKSDIIGKFKVDQKTLDRALEKCLKYITQKPIEEVKLTQDQLKMAKKIYDAGSLNAGVMISVMRRQQFSLFKYLLSLMTQLSKDQIDKILEKYSVATFATMCKGIGVSESDFTSLFLLVGPFTENFRNMSEDLMKQTISMYKGLDIIKSRNLLKKWREEPNSFKDVKL